MSPGSGSIRGVSVSVVIPARWASSRFPGKPLVPLLGRPMIEWVHRAAAACPGVARVIVATDDERIASACRSFGADVVMTRSDHATGTDRIAEVAASLDDGLIVNVQGDEPLLEPEMIERLIAVKRADAQAKVATLVAPGPPERFDDPNCVKAVLDARGRALYFSRAPVPSIRKGVAPPPYWQHLGLYAYDREYLLHLVSLPEGRLELVERLEQLRVLEAGDAIAVGVIDGWEGTAVDVVQDVARAEAALRARVEER